MGLADVAQLAVHRTCNAKVAGSSPAISFCGYDGTGRHSGLKIP